MMDAVRGPETGADPLARLDTLVERARQKVSAKTAEPQAPAAEEPDFSQPGEVERFMGAVLATADQGGDSPFASHALDPARVARLLAD
jgi:hypothetical protein